MPKMHRLIISLGSNQDAEAKLAEARSFLYKRFLVIYFSETIHTEPVGMPGATPFLNQVALTFTAASPEEVREDFKKIENWLGRTPESKQQGQIPIDLDLLLWDDTVLKPDDWEREYVQLLVRSITNGPDEDEG